MLQALSSLAGVHMPSEAAQKTMGGSLARVLWRALELQRVVERASARGASEGSADQNGTRAQLQGSTHLQPLSASLGDRVGSSSRCALEHAEEAIAAGSRVETTVTAWTPSIVMRESGMLRQWGSIGSGPPTMEELSKQLGGMGPQEHGLGPPTGDGVAHSQRGFRDAYMAVLAGGAAEQLDALRREGPPMDDAALAMLVDALEYGAHSFTPEQRELFEASFCEARDRD